MRTARPVLISVTRTLFQRADEARRVPLLLPWLEEAELALALLEDRHSAAMVAADQLRVQVALALESERTLDRQVMLFSQRLKGMVAGGDAIAEAAVQALFPRGASAITRHSGRVLLTACTLLRARLEVTPLPAGLAAEPARIAAGIDSFTANLLAKERLHRQLRSVQREAAAAKAGLLQSLVRLEKGAMLYLSADVMAIWSEPVRTMGRRTARSVPAR